MLKVGDRVRFLNAVGGGVVKGIKDRNIVLVEDEDGFDVPVPVSELVVVAEEQDRRMRRSRDDDRPSSGNTSVSMRQLLNQDVPDEDPTQPDESTDVPSPSLFTADLDTPQGENLNVSLVVSPHGEGHFDFYLLNDSNYALLYVVSTQADSHLMCRDAGTAESHTRVLLSDRRRIALRLGASLAPDPSVQALCSVLGQTGILHPDPPLLITLVPPWLFLRQRVLRGEGTRHSAHLR